MIIARERCNKILLSFFMLIFLFLVAILFSNKVSAIDYKSINNKALYTGVYNCLPVYLYNGNNNTIIKKGKSVHDILIPNDIYNWGGFVLYGTVNDIVRLPYNSGIEKKNYMGCENVLFGSGSSFSGLLPNVAKEKSGNTKGKITDNNIKQIVEVFAGSDLKGGYDSLNYSAVGNGEKEDDAGRRLIINLSPTNTELCGGGEVYLTKYKYEASKYFQYLAYEDKDPNSGDSFENVGSSLLFPATNGTKFNFSVTPSVNVPDESSAQIYRVCNDKNAAFGVRYDGKNTYTVYSVFDGYMNSGIKITPSTDVKELSGNVSNSVHIEKVEYASVSAGGSYEEYIINYKGDKMPFLRGLSNQTESGFSPWRLYEVSDLKLDDQEVYDLYTYYLNTIFGVPVICEGEDNYDTYKNSLKPVLWAKDKNCGARTVDHVKKISDSVFGVFRNYYFGNTLYSTTVDGRNDGDPSYGIDEVISMLNLLDKNKITNWLEGGSKTGEIGVGSEEDLKTEQPNCANSSGAESLGWILCPVMKVLGDAATGVYEKYVEPSLRVEPKLFTANDGVRQAWETFRNIANFVFIILLLVVIFSQLTGVGIDNYGIKKILPKLIVAAILINLSYVVCMVFVDLSNILGNALKAMFDGFSANLGVPAISISESNAGEVLNKTMNEIGSTALTSVVILGALVAMVGAVWSNPAILLSILVAALGVVISIFFLFILLSVREAAIVVLVAISPLALVCYILPNTKKMFDKWLKLFEGLLIVYPICGLLVGGGNYVSNLLLTVKFSEDGFLPAFTAMIVGIVPIFFIPTVLKGSFTAMGNLGAKISGFGKNARLGAVRRMRNGNLYKNAQQAGLERQTRMRAGLKLNKDGTVSQTTGFRRSLGTIMSGGRRGRQRNALAYQKMVAERGSLEAADEADFMLETETSNEMKRLVASGEINNTSGLQSGLEDALVSGDRAKIRAYTDALTAKGKDGRTAVNNAYFNSREKMSTGAARTFANNILSKHTGDYKTNRRGVYELAKAINGKGTEGELSGFLKTMDKPEFIESIQGKLVEKAKSGSLAGMDNEAFDETFGVWGKNDKGERVITGYAIPEGFSDDEKRAIGENIYNALRNADDMDTKRVANLRALYEQCGYTPDVQNVNVVNRGIGDSAVARNNMHNEYLEQQGTSAAELEEINRRRDK